MWKKDSNIAPSLFYLILFGPSLFYGLFSLFYLGFFGLFFFIKSGDSSQLVTESLLPSSFPHMGQCSNNEDHHTFIYLQLKNYNSILGTNMTLCECLRRCTGMCNESRVTCMKNYAWWLCHKYDVNYMIMQSNMTMMERVIINRTVESCMAIYLGMAMEMPR